MPGKMTGRNDGYEKDGYDYGWRWPNGDYAWWPTRYEARAHDRGLCGPGEPVRRVAADHGPVLEGHDPAPHDRDGVGEEADALPLTQQLILETLAARYRCGEYLWTFDKRCTRALKALEAAGWVGWKGGIVHGTVLAWMTDKARVAMLSPTYAYPALADVTEFTLYPAGCHEFDRPRAGDFAVQVRRGPDPYWTLHHRGEQLPGKAARLDVALERGQQAANDATVDGKTWLQHRGYPQAP